MRLLIVDAGNYSRSPAAEAVLGRLLSESGLAGRVAVGSAGLKDKHAGDPPDPRTVAVCAMRGLDLGDFRCRQIGPKDFRDSNMILAMDRENLKALEALRPAGTGARLGLFLDALDGGEVPDPYYGGPDGFDLMIDLIERGGGALVRDLEARDVA